MAKDVIIALDFSGREETLSFLDKFTGRKPFVKIGMELFYATGAEFLKELKARGHKIFLDLKLYDIPNTVKKAMNVLSSLGADMCNLHASGGSKMMKAAIEGLTKPDGTRPILIGVTMLTSTDEETMKSELLIDRPLEDVVAAYARNTALSGLDGVVCSPLESARVHEVCGKDFITVTPGVRLAGDDVADQKRVTTPAKARELGSDYIVVGRSITGAQNPVEAYEECLRQFVGEEM